MLTVPASAPHQHALRARLRTLYRSAAPGAVRFRYALLALDTASVAWIVATSFLTPGWFVWTVDIALGAVLLAEFAARFAATPRPLREAVRLVSLADLVAILSLLLAPILPHSAAFLRALRLLRLARSPRVLAQLRADLPGFRRNEEALVAATDLATFLFVMTAAVYESQHLLNGAIKNYGDALYFTVTALTTTGFGDITPRDTFGRLLTVVIMLAGVTLFLRLAQALFRPAKVRFPCPTCALQRHDADAVHCKACGTVLNIPDEGDG
ncbi:potassium channel family protein [Roseomonas sp. CCTCC AB2023176]|uniref:potassium channel family protein n=1 Tax=Roseomonas sp. CCTCC AB2023176 TaxID=3342640 RepID=UPI0035DD946D